MLFCFAGCFDFEILSNTGLTSRGKSEFFEEVCRIKKPDNSCLCILKGIKLMFIDNQPTARVIMHTLTGECLQEQVLSIELDWMHVQIL